MLNKEYDLIIKKSLEKYLEAEFSDVPNEDEIDYEFSNTFNKKMEKIINRLEHPYWYFVNTTARKVAVIVVCIILIVTSLLSVTAVREKIVEFFYEVFDTHTAITLEDDEDFKDIIDTQYTIATIPNEYINVSEFKDDMTFNLVWENSNKQTIIFFQKLSKDVLNLNSEDVLVKETTVNNTPCVFMQQEEDYIYYWEFDGYSFTVHYPVSLGEEFAEQVIGKLVEYKN